MATQYELRTAGKTFTGTLAEIYEQAGAEFLPSSRLDFHRRYIEANPGVLESVDMVAYMVSVISRSAARISECKKVSR